MSKNMKDKFLSAECSSKCRSKKDGDKLAQIVSRSSDEASLVYIATSGICSNPGKVVDSNGRSLLHIAASVGKRSVVEWLLRFKDASVNSKDQESGYSPLHRSLLHGQIDVAKFLIDSGANLWIQDQDGLTPFDHLAKDRVLQPGLSRPSEHKDLCEVFLWGTNANYNLGLGHQQQRPQPELSDHFRKESIFCKQIALQKFHSAFLTTKGQALTCGHGQGGRLGLGSEDPQLTPHPIKVPSDQICISVALGVDHSLFLMATGVIWSCGSNAFHQLGQQPPPKQLTTPQPIHIGGKNRLPAAVGIGAARFHSLFWTRDALYTWGLNAGQLGHLRTDDKTISAPKLVSAFTDKRIRDISTSDAAIVVLTENGDVVAIQDFASKRILSTKQFDVVKMVAVGGHLDSKTIPNLDLIEGGGDDLKVYFLTRNGRIFVYQDNRQQTQANFCLFIATKELWITDLCAGKSGSLFVVTRDGEGFELSHKSAPKLDKADKKSENFSDILKVRSRLPCIFRANSIACDPKGKNFGVLQVCPNAELCRLPEIESSNLKTDFRRLLEETDEFDALHDLKIIAGDRMFFAHKLVLAASCEKMSKLVRPDEDFFRIPDTISPETFELVLQFVYYRSCDLLKAGSCATKTSQNKSSKKDSKSKSKRKNSESEFLKISDDSSSLSAFHVYAANGKNLDRDLTRKSKSPENEKPVLNPLTLLAEASNFFGMTNLTNSIKLLTNKNLTKTPSLELKFNRKSYPEFHDVIICTEDNVQVAAHRCVLAARLDYFRSMFATGCWIEGRRNETLKLPVSSRLIMPLIDFVYTDELKVGTNEDPEFFCNLIVTADQFLVPRLIQLCEQQLAGMLTMKNVGEILQFAHDFNAVQLKNTCMEFCGHNLGSLLESKGLETVDRTVLKDLSTFYQMAFRCVASRRLTPLDGGPTTDEIEQYFAECELSVQDVFRLEEEELEKASPQKSGKKKPSSRNRTLSTESIGSTVSDSDDEARPKPKKEESIFDEFEMEERPAVSQTEECVKETHDNNREADKVLSSFFAGKQHDKLPTVRKPPVPSAATSTPENKRFTKPSQREMKRLLSMGHSTKQINDKEASPEATSPKPAWSGWSKKPDSSASGPASLSAIMAAEVRKNRPAETVPAKKVTTWRQISFDTPQPPPTPPSSAPKNPWKTTPSTAATPISTSDTIAAGPSTNFKQILREEKKESENLNRAITKPLAATQIEEKAIEELKKFYNVESYFDENIKIDRVEGERMRSTPVWKKNLSAKK